MAGTTKDIRDRVIEKLQEQLQRTQAALEKANQRISELEKQLGKSPSAKFDASFSVEAEEKRQQRRGRKKKAKKSQKRRGRITTAQKVAQAARRESVYPAGVSPQACQLSHTRPVWRIENGQAVLVAYDVYRGPQEPIW